MKPFKLEQMEYILAFIREAIDGIKKTHYNESHFWGGEDWFDVCIYLDDNSGEPVSATIYRVVDGQTKTNQWIQVNL